MGLTLKWFDLCLELKISKNSYHLEGQIGQFNIEHFDKITNNNNQEKKVELFNSDHKNTKPFLHILFETKNEGKEEDKTAFFRIFLEINTIEVKFFPIILRRTISYFSFSSSDENLKKKAYKKVKSLQKLTQVLFFN